MKAEEQVHFSDSSFLEMSINKAEIVDLDMISPTVAHNREDLEDDDDLERDIINGLGGAANMSGAPLRIQK